MSVAFANFAAPLGGLAGAGRSAIWSQRGACVAQPAGSGAGMAVASEDDGEWCGRTHTLWSAPQPALPWPVRAG